MNPGSISKTLLLFCFIVSFSLGDKLIMLGSFNVITLLTWFAILLSSIIIFYYSKKTLFALLLIASVFATKILEIASPAFSPLYFTSVGLLYALAGAIIFAQNRNMIYKQVMVIVFINVIFQTLQLIGVWEWPYWFSTIGIADPQNIFFVEYNDLNIQGPQLRPAGILSSPTWLSLFTSLAIALHFTRNKNVIPFGSLLIISIIIISNSKFPILFFLIIALIIYLYGSTYQKGVINKSILLFIGFYFIYSILFPGVVKSTMDPELWAWSFFVRLNNLLQIWYPDNNAPLILQLFTYGTAVEPGTEKSYFTVFAKLSEYKNLLIYLIPVSFVFFWFYIKRYKELNCKYTYNLVFPLLCLIIVSLYTLMFPILEVHFYYFILGGALIPLLISGKKPLFNYNYI
jgi:hypothetical protein